MDFKKAYDSVRREVLCNIIIEFGVPVKLVRLIKMWLNETYSKFHIGKNLSDAFSLQNKEMLYHHYFSTLLYNAIRKVQEHQVGLKFNGTRQLLVSADGMNLLGDNIDTIKSTESLIDASKEVFLEVNTEKTKYMLLSRHQNAGQNHDIEIANRFTELFWTFSIVLY
jgi:hypothetical protein